MTMRFKVGLCCGSFWGIMIIVIFSVLMANLTHLGPDEQMVLKKSTGKYVVNGPYSGILHPFHSGERRKAVVFNALQYGIVTDDLTALKRVVKGPDLFFLEAHEEVSSIHNKIVLEGHRYIRLSDKFTGKERVVKGPGTVVPTVTEVHKGIENCVFLDVANAIVVRNKLTGVQRLQTYECNNKERGVFYPSETEEIVDRRELIHVEPHEAVVVRDVTGEMTVYSGREDQQNNDNNNNCGTSSASTVGGTAFFLKPHSKIVRMQWSTFPHPSTTGGDEETNEVTNVTSRRLEDDAKIVVVEGANGEIRRLESMYVDVHGTSKAQGEMKTVTAIDLRTHKSFYEYEVRTSDNVRLSLEGIIFWKISEVRKMLTMTSDPEGDVWSKSRATLIAAIGKVTLKDFMEDFNRIVTVAFDDAKGAEFFTVRGLEPDRMELNGYKPKDRQTADTLQSIIRQTVVHLNNMEKQRGENDVAQEKMKAELELEEAREQLIDIQAENTKIQAETDGNVKGAEKAHAVTKYIDGMKKDSGASDPQILELLQDHMKLESSQIDTRYLSTGTASLYMAPKEMELRLNMPKQDL